MTRRSLLIASLAQLPAQSLIRPKPLRPGDTIGLITPSTYVSDPDRLALAEQTVRYFGLKRINEPKKRGRRSEIDGPSRICLACRKPSDGSLEWMITLGIQTTSSTSR